MQHIPLLATGRDSIATSSSLEAVIVQKGCDLATKIHLAGNRHHPLVRRVRHLGIDIAEVPIVQIDADASEPLDCRRRSQRPVELGHIVFRYWSLVRHQCERVERVLLPVCHNWLTSPVVLRRQ